MGTNEISRIFIASEWVRLTAVLRPSVVQANDRKICRDRYLHEMGRKVDSKDLRLPVRVHKI